jgi:hypothetical protein
LDGLKRAFLYGSITEEELAKKLMLLSYEWLKSLEVR